MTPDSIETYRQIMVSLQGMEREIGEVKAGLERMAAAMESTSEARRIAREEHNLCRSGIEKRMDRFEQDADTRIQHLEDRTDTLITWGKAIGIIGGFIAVVLVVLNVLQAVGISV